MSEIIQCKKGEGTQWPKGPELIRGFVKNSVAGERCNVTGEYMYFEKGSTSE